MSILINELKKKLMELESKHKTKPLPSIVIEMEFSRKPILLKRALEEYKGLEDVFKGFSIKGEISGNEYVIYNLPQVIFDSNTFRKIEEVAYDRFNIDSIVDVPPIPHPRYGRESSGGLELLKDGKPVATLYSTRFHINTNYDQAEKLAEVLLKEVYKYEEKPGLLEILFWKFKKFLKRVFRGKK
ncbi:MAG: hypothetical protein N3E39_00200 [Candidatus Methanomethylicia archaeon]|nr:hypothetical protein [Candidatus Methanomethylicia archaeon]